MTTEDEKMQEIDFDQSIITEVNEVWNKIDSTNDEISLKKSKNDKESLSSSEFKVARIFVSSTFSDFFNEREILAKRV